jgi:hypothetical protein
LFGFDLTPDMSEVGAFQAHKTRQLESGDSFHRSPYNYHQRDRVCRISMYRATQCVPG